MSAPLPQGGFSLFPSTGRPPSRSQAVRPQQQAVSPVSPAAPADTVSPVSPANQIQSQYPTVGEAVTAEVRIERPAPVADIPWRSDAAPPDFQTLVRNGSARSRSSIAKMRLSIYDSDAPPPRDASPPPLPGPSSAAAANAYGQIFPQEQRQQRQQQQQQQSHQQQQQQQQQQQEHRPPALRSIFPQYNPELSLDQQDYYPTQTSPGRIPRGIISRPLYSPTQQEQEQEQQQMGLDGAHEPLQQQHQTQTQTRQTQRTRPALQLTLQTSGPAMYSPQGAGVTSVGVAAPPTTTAAPVRQVWPPPRMGGSREAPTLPVASTSEELGSFWKVANGWKAGPSEGRVYCMNMTCDKDAPVYRLSSASHQPLYRMRVDPTSMSAYVTLSRHDPARPFKPESGRGRSKNGEASLAAGGSSGSNGGSQGGSRRGSTDDDVGGVGGSSAAGTIVGPGTSTSTGMGMGMGMGSASTAMLAAETQTNARHDASRHWQAALTTTLEEEARRHQPSDGLVALLYPQQAARMALEQPGSAVTVATAERECARLVWDDDSARFFVVHPVLALPFCVGIERSATWSRTAYTLEHLESPQHLARLTRDGTGAGWLEVDTAVAGKIDAVYLVDVAVAALLLVAHGDQHFAQVVSFAPPPAAASVGTAGGGNSSAAAAAAAAAGGRPSFGSGTARASLVNIVMSGAAAATGHRSSSRLSGFRGPVDGQQANKTKNKNKNKKNKKRGRMEELELDLESQTSIDFAGKAFEVGGSSRRKKTRGKNRRHHDHDDDHDDEKMPGCLRLIAALLKCCFWCVTMVVRAAIAIVSALFRCITSEKL